MSVSLVYMKDGAKMTRPIFTREEYFKLRNAPENAKNFYDARNGNEQAKADQVQFCYNDLLPDGVLKGCCHPSSTFAHDIDCGDQEEQQRIKEVLLAKKEEIGLLELSGSARYGLHAVCRRQDGKTIRECQYALSMATQTEYDTNARGLARVMFTGPATEDNLFYLDDAIFEEAMSVEESAKEFKRLKEREKKNLEEVPVSAKKANKHYRPWEEEQAQASSPESGEDRRGLIEGMSGASSDHPAHPGTLPNLGGETATPIAGREEVSTASMAAFDMCAELAGLTPGAMDVWGEHNWHANLMAVLSVGVGKLMSRQQLMAVVAKRLPNYSQTEDCQKLIDYFYEKYDADKGFMNASLREINARAQKEGLFRPPLAPPNLGGEMEAEEDSLSNLNSQFSIRKMPLGVKDSIDAVGPGLAMPVVTAICPCIGALATGVKLDVHGKKRGLNIIAYIAGDFASRKGDIDPVIDAWMSEVKALDIMYQQQEQDFRSKKLAAKNKKDQPEEPKLPVRCITLNTTVANLAERLANTDGKHAFSFTPEADTVAQKWRSAMSDFSVLLRQSYDGSRYEREARSAEAVNVHIEHLLWNVCMCGTPDCLYRVVQNYTDGFQSRIAIARTPDNTFAQLEDNPPTLTERQTEHIQQVAHLLQLMQGEVVLPKLEARGRTWLEKIRLETMMNDDKVKARQRFRVCVTAQRMTCCLMLCKVCETLIQKHGLSGAETLLKQKPTLWKEMLVKAQTPTMLEAYDAIADSLMDNALYFFRDRIENAFSSRNYAGNGERKRIGKNDTIFERLDIEFTFDSALQHSVAIKGSNVTRNSVHQMLKNWKRQGLITQTETGSFKKVTTVS